MDRSLLRFITGAHVKTQKGFLYLETGALDIEKIIAHRRMMYLQTIIKRSDDELTRKIYECQKRMPVKGDWIELVQKDFENAGMEMNEAEIMNQSKDIKKSKS